MTSNNRSPPQLLKPAVASIDKTKTVTIQFEIKAAPKPSLGWTFNNNPIREGLKHKSELSGNTQCFLARMSIKNFGPDDLGLYKCEVRNFRGQLLIELPIKSTPGEAEQSFEEDATKSKELTKVMEKKTLIPKPSLSKPTALASDKKPTIDNYSESKKSISRIFPDGIAIVGCSVSTVNEPQFKWVFNNKDLSKSQRHYTFLIKETSVYFCYLLIRNVGQEDTGEYELTVGSVNDQEKFKVELRTIDYKGSSLVEPPSLVKKPIFEKRKQEKTFSSMFTINSPSEPAFYLLKDLKLADSAVFKTFMTKNEDNTFLISVKNENWTAKDAGNYSCIILNETGGLNIPFVLKSDGEEIKLSKSAATFPSVSGTKIKRLKSGDTLIENIVICENIPKISWYKAGNKEIMNLPDLMPTMQTDGNQHTAKLRIKKLMKESMIFKMNAKNSTGESFINIYVAPLNRKEEASSINLSTPKISMEDEKLHVQCECDSQTEPNVKWLKDERQLKSKSNKLTMAVNRTRVGKYLLSMDIQTPIKDDVGTYKIEVEDSNKNKGQVKFEVTADHIKVSSIKQQAPKFTNKVTDKEYKNGDAAKLSLTFTAADAEVKIRWYLNDQPITLLKGLTIMNEKDKTMLTLVSVDESHAGLYKCELQNSAGKDVTEFRISLEKADTMKNGSTIQQERVVQHQSPKFTILPENVTAAKDENVTINAQLTGVPFPKITWNKSSKILRDGPKYKIFNDEKTGKLKLEIIRTKLSDDGIYSLKASNLQGEVSHEFRVFVKEKGTDVELRAKLKKLPTKVDRSDSDKAAQSTGSENESEGDGTPRRSRNRFGSDSEKRFSITDSSTIQWPSLKKTTVKKKEPMRWVKDLEDVQANEVDAVATLKATFCKEGGTLRWYKNRVEIFHGLKYNFVSNGTEHKLVIRKLHPDDSGRYICSINDIETRAWLEVAAGKIVYEFYKMLPTKLEVFRTKTTILECHVSNEDCPIKWYKGKQLIDSQNPHFKMYIDGVRCVLRIQRTSKEDEGVFKCEIDDGDHQTTTCYLYVTEPQWRFRKKLPSEIEVDERNDLILEVEVEDPEAECEWFYQGEPINQDVPSEKYSFVYKDHVRKMIIHNADPDLQNGKYECRTGVMSTFTNVRVKPALKIRNALTDVHIKEGEDLNLSIELNMKGKVVSWFKDGHLIKPSETAKITSDGCVYKLKILNPSLSDAGQYSFKIDDVQSECSVEIEEADYVPKVNFDNDQQKIMASVGDEVKIPVHFKGKPKPTIKLLIDGKEVKEENITLEETGDGCLILVKNAKRINSGSYEMVVKNKLGEGRCKAMVNIAAAPMPPQGPINIMRVTRNSCSISWSPPNDDGGSPIQKYVIEKMDESEGRWDVCGECSDHNFTITGLTEGNKYKFRVKALNRVGESEYLETRKAIKAKPEFVPPSSPGNLKVTDVKSESATLSWTVPEKDGNAKVEKYIIEVKNRTGSWKTFKEVGGDELFCVLDGLEPNSEYEFRVIACNAAGRGEESKSCEKFRTEKMQLPPVIDKSLLRPITIKSGKDLKLTVKYTSQPPPTLTWLLNGKEEKISNAKIEMSDNSATITIPECIRSQSGTYSIKLENELGTDTANVDVNVLSAPCKPMGPIKVSDVTKNSVFLEWEKPVDDGGKAVTNYIVEKREAGSEDWSKVNDLVTQTSFRVPKLKENVKYEFRVKAENSEGLSDAIVTDQATLVKDPYDPPSPPGIPIPKSRDRSQISFEWTEPKRDGGAKIKGYIIERLDSATNKWRKLNTIANLCTDCQFTDDSVRADREYQYRVAAVNIAGESEVSDESLKIPAKPEKEEPKISMFSFAPDINGRYDVKVKAGTPFNLELDVSGTPKPEAKWSRKDEKMLNEGSFNLDVNEEKLKIEKANVSSSDNGIYELEVSNEMGKDCVNINLIVLDVPEKPVGPIETSNPGLHEITLSWKPPAHDGNSTIINYVVEKCLEGTDNWELCSDSVVSNKYTVHNLKSSAKYKFRIMAENKYGLSAPLETSADILIRPPYDPPAAPSAPQIIDYDPSSIRIKWEKPLNDGGNAISSYVVEMRKNDAEWVVAASERPAHSTSFNVTGLTPNAKYQFRVKAVNDAGSGRPSLPSDEQETKKKLNVPDIPLKPVIEAITKDSCVLNWSKLNNINGRMGEDSEPAEMIIEMSEDGIDWRQVAVSPFEMKKCKICDLVENQTVSFRVRAKNEAGISEASDMSDFIVIENEAKLPEFVGLYGCKKVTVKIGEPIDVKLKQSSMPLAECSMLKNKIELTGEEDSIECSIDENEVTLFRGEAKRSDSGRYEIQLKNKKGSCSAFVEINVIGSPTAPRGPLKIFNIEGTSCNLSWSVPESDGGGVLGKYVIEKRLFGDDNDWEKACSDTRSTECKIEGLQNAAKYEFRVVAQNEFGRSEPLESLSATKIKFPFEKPGPPSHLTSKDHNYNQFTIKWDKPTNDGGNDIVGYMIEYKDVQNDAWIALNKQPVDDTEAVVYGLMEGNQYEVRVAAVNKAGKGEWCDSDVPIEARAPDAVPVLYGFESGKKEVKVKVDEPFSFRIPFVASPKPQASLKKGGINASDDIHVEVQDGQVNITCGKAKLDHSGVYTFSLVNDLGQCDGTVSLNVVDRPSKPTGPLVASLPNPDGCTLTWQAPNTDGGEPVSNYIIQKCDLDRPDQWTDVFKPCKNETFTVTGLEPKHRYKFRVLAENMNGISDPLETLEPVITEYPFSVPEKPKEFQAKAADCQTIDLSWTRPKSDRGSKISEYKIEMKQPNENVWITVDTLSPKSTELSVSDLLPGTKYEFRIMAKNEAGYSEPLLLSEPIVTKSPISKPDKPNSPSVLETGKDFAVLCWDAPLLAEVAPIIGYVIEQKDAKDIDWKKAASVPVNETKATVSNLPNNSMVEFRLRAVNEAGESEASSSSVPVRITEFPNGSKPEFVKKPQSLQVALNDSAEFNVEFEGLPAPEVTWYRNGLVVSAGTRYTTKSDDNKSMLSIMNVWENDNDSIIKCELKNIFGTCVDECVLKVKEAPKIDDFPKDQTINAGDSCRLKIPVNGSGPFKFKLMKDGEVFPLSKTVKISEIGGVVSLVMNDCQRDQIGDYLLNIANDSGSVNAAFNVKILDKATKPNGPLQVSNVSKNECTLNWKVPDDDGGSKITEYIVEKRDVTAGDNDWSLVPGSYREPKAKVSKLMNGHQYEFRVAAVNANGTSEYLNGDELVNIGHKFGKPAGVDNVDFGNITNNSVKIKWSKPPCDQGDTPIDGYFIEKREANSDQWIRVNAQSPTMFNSENVTGLLEGHEYQFRIIPFNEVGEADSSTATQFICIEDKDAIPAPVIKKKLKNCRVNEGESVNFEVDFEAPNATITWLKNGELIEEDQKHTIEKDATKSCLRIKNVTKQNCDLYTVKITNKSGSKSAHASLEVNAAPKLKGQVAGINDVSFKVGETIQLKIPFNGVPLPDLEWKKDGEGLMKDGRVEYEICDKCVLLTIPSADVSDSGLYDLRLSNEVGSVNAQYRISVIGRPDAPVDVKCSEISEDTILVNWTRPEKDGGSEITNFLLERQEYGSDEWVRSGFVTSGTKCLVEHLQPEHQYRFRVVAENLLGRSDPSLSSDFITTLQSKMKRKASIGVYGVDENGIPLRGLPGHVPSNYDKCYQDIWAHGSPTTPILKQSSIYDHYDIFEELSKTSECIVHRAIERNSGKTYIVKFCNTSDKDVKELVNREVQIGKELKHRNIMNLHDVFESPNETALVYEFLSGDDLVEGLHQKAHTITEQQVAQYVRQVCEAVEHMHDKNIMDLNLKPTGVMFNNKNGECVKLVDFSSARKLAPNDEIKLSLDNAQFSAPELINGTQVGFYTDMWSIGALAYFLLTGKSPITGKDIDELSENFATCSIDFDCDELKSVSESAKDFMRKLLVKDQSSRMTINEALSHPWLTPSSSTQQQDVQQKTTLSINKQFLEKARERNRTTLEIEQRKPMVSRAVYFTSTYELKDDELNRNYTRSKMDHREAVPRFLIRPHNAYCLQGNNASFDCRVIGLSPPTVSWYRNGIEIKQSQKYSKKVFGPNYGLEIKKCTMEDAGRYEVKISNSYGERTTTVNLNVEQIRVPQQPPKAPVVESKRSEYQLEDIWSEPDRSPMFTYHLRSRVIQAGQYVKLTCTLTGKPAPKITWYKDKSEIRGGETDMLVVNDHGVCSLEIESAESVHAGWYRCVAENDRGIAESACQLLIVGSNYRQVQSSMGSSSGQDYFASESGNGTGTGLSSTLSSSSLSTTKSRLPFAIERTEKFMSTRTVRGSGGVGRSPNFIKLLNSQKITEACRLLLNCTFTGSPEPHIEWYKNGRLIGAEENARVQILKSATETSLIIENVVSSDAAQYRCKLSNGSGSAESSASVLVMSKENNHFYEQTTYQLLGSSNQTTTQQPRYSKFLSSTMATQAGAAAAVAIDSTSLNKRTCPRFIRFLNSMILNEGDTMDLTVCVDDVNCTAQWFRNNKLVPISSEFEMISNEGTHRLRVASVYPEDSGVFTVELTSLSTGAIVNSNCTVIVRALNNEHFDPCIMSFPQSAQVHANENVTFKCVAVGSQPMSAIWSKSGLRLPNNGHFEMTTDTGNTFILNINNVTFNDFGIYEIRVINSNGDMIVVFDVNVVE